MTRSEKLARAWMRMRRRAAIFEYPIRAMAERGWITVSDFAEREQYLHAAFISGRPLPADITEKEIATAWLEHWAMSSAHYPSIIRRLAQYVLDQPCDVSARERERMEQNNRMVEELAAAITGKEEAERLFTEHTQHVQSYLQKLWAEIVDPVDNSTGNVAQTCDKILEVARQQHNDWNRLTERVGQLEGKLKECVAQARIDIKTALAASRESGQRLRKELEKARDEIGPACAVVDGKCDCHHKADRAYEILSDAPDLTEPCGTCGGTRRVMFDEISGSDWGLRAAKDSESGVPCPDCSGNPTPTENGK